jgi:serine/threonine protein phosphatase PrpC
MRAKTASGVKERRRVWMGGRLIRPDDEATPADRPDATAPPAAPRPGPVRWVEFCAATETGPVRPSHQDALVVGGAAALAAGTRVTGWLPLGGDGVLLAAVDGMGGYAGGAEAAALVASTLAAEGTQVDSAMWGRWLERLSGRVAAAGEAWGTPQMGATVAVARLTENRVESVNIGDCRLYRVRDGYVGQLSIDDRLPGSLSGGVTQSLGGGPRELDPHRLDEELGPAPVRLMACSDGLFGALGHDALRRPLIEARSPAEACDRLVAAAWAEHATDNFSVIVADVASLGDPPPASPAGPAVRRPG